jgi:hypothetical protein
VTGRWLGPAFWCALGVFIAWQSHATGLGSFAEPGPGMVSFALGTAMALIGAARAFTAQAADAPRGVPWRVVAVAAVLAGYFLLLVPAGYLLATFALMLVLLRGFSGLRWISAIGLALGAALATYAIFKLGLGVQLPAGLLA